MGRAVDEFDGFVFVTPEYNHSVPAALKNAFDVLYPEWGDKPMAFVGYGADGATPAVEHWRTIVANARMVAARAQVSLSLFDDFTDGQIAPIERREGELCTCSTRSRPSPPWRVSSAQPDPSAVLPTRTVCHAGDARIHGLLLAAGAGRRMDGRKALVTDPDGTSSARSVAVLREGGCDAVTVVLGAAAAAGAARLGLCRRGRRRGRGRGTAASLRAGLAALPETAEVVVVSLVDLPDVDRHVVRRVLDAAAGPDALVRRPIAGSPVTRCCWVVTTGQRCAPRSPAMPVPAPTSPAATT